MLHPAWIAREAPLAQCPLAACRRSKQRRHSTDNDPSRRLHQTMHPARTELADMLDRPRQEHLAKLPPGVYRLTMHLGDVTDADAVEDTLFGQDAVLSTLGVGDGLVRPSCRYIWFRE